jgi:hypothetical protein
VTFASVSAGERTGSAAFAGKPGGTTPTPIVVVNGDHHWIGTDTRDSSVGYHVPVAPAVRSGTWVSDESDGPAGSARTWAS